MSGTMLSGLHDAAVVLLDADLTRLADPAVVEALADLERIRCMLDTAGHGFVAEAEQRRLARGYSASSTADLLVRRLRLTPAEATSRVRRAEELTPRPQLSGDRTAPLLPLTAEAGRAGEVSADHAAAISRGLFALPTHLDTDTVATVEAVLVDCARQAHPGEVARFAAAVAARFDQDGPEPPDPDGRRRDRTLTLTRHGDGTSRLTGLLNVETTAALTAVLDSLAAPVPEPDGTADPRTGGQRNHDALTDLCRRVLRSGDLPTCGGTPVTVLARTTLAEWTTAHGVALTDRGAPWPVPDLHAAASDALVLPVITTDGGAVLAVAAPSGRSTDGWADLWLGRGVRLASRAQRLALAARDGGCTFPDCDRPPPWTEVHHVLEWQDGGPTDIDNLTLLCRYHHRHFAELGWAVRMLDGLPVWAPPPLDRSRTTTDPQLDPSPSRGGVLTRPLPDSRWHAAAALSHSGGAVTAGSGGTARPGPAAPRAASPTRWAGAVAAAR